MPFFSFEYCNRQIEEEIFNAFRRVYDSKSYILGTELYEFEKAYASFNQTNYAIGVANGLEALQICLVALGIGAGDEVIVPSHTFIATITAIVHIGATPILIEPNIATYNIDTTKIESAISSRTKAIIPVHLYGQPCDMNPIVDIAQRHNLFVVEDNAQAQGGEYRDKLTGSFGVLNATSFYPIKNLGAMGDGGAITTSDKVLYDKCLKLRNYGSSRKYFYDELGLNSRLDELQAAFLNVKLPYLKSWNEERRAIAACYIENLSNIPDVKLPEILPDAASVFHIFAIRTKQRDDLQLYLEKKGISTIIHYPEPPHLQVAYSFLNYKKGDFPVTEEIANTILSLPLYIGIDKAHILYVCDCIRSFYGYK